jgi:hypothetical protein
MIPPSGPRSARRFAKPAISSGYRPRGAAAGRKRSRFGLGCPVPRSFGGRRNGLGTGGPRGNRGLDACQGLVLLSAAGGGAASSAGGARFGTASVAGAMDSGLAATGASTGSAQNGGRRKGFRKKMGWVSDRGPQSVLGSARSGPHFASSTTITWALPPRFQVVAEIL